MAAINSKEECVSAGQSVVAQLSAIVAAADVVLRYALYLHLKDN